MYLINFPFYFLIVCNFTRVRIFSKPKRATPPKALNIPTTDDDEIKVTRFRESRSRGKARLERSKTVDSSSLTQISSTKSATSTVVEQTAQITQTAIEKGKILKWSSKDPFFMYTRSLRFAIFWEIFENCQLKILLNSKILQIVTVL